MNQRLLTNFSLIVIKYAEEQQEYCMGSESFLRSEIFLSNDQTESNFENYLFYAQSELNSNYEFKNNLEFEQQILFRHKVSNKFLSYLVEYGDDENDSIIKIQLSDKPCYFKILPCFQYQTKISSKVKFNQDIYLATELNSAKLGYVNVRPGNHSSQLKTIFSLNEKSKLILHSYFQLEKQEKDYIYGQAVWIKHVESRSFVTVFKPETDGTILYEPLQVEDDLQSINGLWVIESTRIQVGGILSFHEAFYLKSLSTNKYLSFDPNFTIVKGENIFKVILVDRPNQLSRFQFLSLKGQQSKIKKGSYLIFKHQKTGSYIGTRKIYSEQSITHYQPTTFNQFEDQDLFDLLQLQKQQEQPIRFICSIKKELNIISQILKIKDQPLSRRVLSQFQCLYSNIIGVLKKLQNDRLFNEVKQQMSSSIQFFCIQLKLLKQKISQFPQTSKEVIQLVKHVYTIFQIICKNYKDNQILAYKYIYEYVDDIFKDYGAEELLCQIFSHNYSLLCKVPNKIKSIGNRTIVSVVLNKINQMNIEKEKTYWMKIQKLLNFLETTLQYRQKIIDINQRLISTELFEVGYFNSIFFQIKIFNQRVRMYHPQQNKWIQIQQINDKTYILMLQRIFHLFSMLCENRNFISKQFINKYLNQLNKDGIKVMISYLNIPISVKLANSMLSLITNCYIDSAPRINRYKPLAVLNFSFSDDDSVISDRPTLQSNLKEALLNKGQNVTKYQSNSWKVSNTLQGLHSDEPGLNQEQLDLYKTQLNEKIGQNQWSKQLLRSVCILMKLQSYTSEQIQQIQRMLISNMMDEDLDNDIMAQTMYIFQQIHVFKQELELKKVTSYLKYKFSQSNSGEIQKQDIKYYISYKSKAKSVWMNSKQNQTALKTDGDPDLLQEKGSSKKYRRQYNHIIDKLKVFSASTEIKQKLLNIFINNQKYPFSILSAIFKTILNFYSPQLTMVKLLAKSIILTHDQVQNFQQIYKLYKKVKHLTSIGQYWLTQSMTSQSTQSKTYCYTMLQFTNYLYEDYVLQSQTDRRFRKSSKISINRQLLVLNLAVHEVSLEFINTNLYLLENKRKNQISEKIRKVFEINFQFLYHFCQNCSQNLEVVIQNLEIISRFQSLPEVGQSKLLILLYRQSSNLIKQIRSQTIQKIVCKIIQSPINVISHNQCQYSPQYSQLLLTICFYKQKVYKKNLQLLFQIIQKQSVLLKLLYIDNLNKKSLCLDADSIKNYPLQVPILYHRNVIKILNLLFINLQSTSSSIKYKIRDIINIDSLFRILALPDLYSHKGTIPQIYFLLKKQVFVLLKIYLQKTDNLLKLYQSEALHSLLVHFINIFLINKDKQSYSCDKQILYLPFIQQHLHQIKYFKQNQRDFYQQHVQPLLIKLLSLFDKYMNKDSNKSYQKLIILIQNINIRELHQDHLLKNQLNGMDLLQLKWRNFVDSDDDNSQEEKFVKKTVLEILRNQESYKMIEIEKINFFKTIKQNQQKYFSSMSKLIEMASQEQNHGNKSEYLLFFYQIIRNLAEYFVWITNQDKEKRKWDGEKLASTLIGYITREEFQYNNTISRKTFFEILRILVFLLENDSQLNLTKELYKMFSKNISCFRFFNCLRDSINQLSERVIGDKAHQQINEAISELYICGQERKCQVDKQALKLIALFCKHIPFTQFLRSQPYNSSIDFLDKIYNSFYFTVKRSNTKQGLAINVTTVDITQSVMESIIALMNGCNKSNQNFIIDNKYPEIVVEVLKIDEISEIRSKAELAKRDRLLQQICNFYLSNGINIEDILNDKIRVMDFSHSYLLSRFKYTLFKIIIQAALANPRGMSKLRILIPIELLKINLIWIYEDYKKQGLLFTEEDILRVKEPWQKIVQQKQLNSVFLMVGFYFFQLIQHNNQVQKQSNQQQGQSAQSEQKQKQKIVRKFFSSISQVQKKQQRIKSLQKFHFAQQMKMFYDKYYQAYEFFKSKNITIEANIYGNLIQLFFPKIPICDKITQQFQDKLIQQAQRISHQEKIKSLMSFQKESYQYLQGEEDYFNQMGNKSALVGKILRFVEDQQKIFLFVWFISVLIVLCYLIDDFATPSTIFTQQFGSYFMPTSIASALILLFSVINLVCGFVLLVNMIFRKIPFFLRLYEFKYKDELAEQGKVDSSLGVYQFKNIISGSFYDIYTIVFSILSIMHPLFAGFLLIYIVKRIAIGRQIVRAIEETWFNLLIAVALLIVFNYIYSIFIYSATFTDDIGYGTTCMTLSTCLKLLVDQSLKGGSGFFSYVDADYNNIGFSFKIVCQITYILFAQKVISEIFSGTIIDKFGELREEGDSKVEDQKSSCFICGQQRFQIDFQLQGFEKHIEHTHNKMNYIYYLFYLRRKAKKQYGIEEAFVWNCHQKTNNQWVPDQTSILKQKKQELEENQNQDNYMEEYQKFYQKKLLQFKKMHVKVESMSNIVKEQNFMI